MTGGAQWNGNQVIATRYQLLSTSSGLYEDLKDFNFSTLSVSTLTVPLWISTPVLYVSDIQGASIDISGISITQDGVFNAPIVSLSSMSLKGFDSLLDLDVSFDLGLGKAIGGIAGGLGALVGGAAIAVGTGAGLAIQGAEQGIATLIAGRPQNFISQDVYETINFTSQLQVSTLGDAYPVYSTIFRTVSSVSANQVPGAEMFVSTFFLPGQICIRSVSDPFNLITGDSNLNTSTIQSFGQWVPFDGLEPTNIEALSVSTINLQASNSYLEFADIPTLNSFTGLFTNAGVSSNLSMNYQAPLDFTIGSGQAASIVGNLQNLYVYTPGIVYTNTSLTGEQASMYLGTNPNESLLNVSSIFSRGSIQGNIGFFSSLRVNDLVVVSTLSTLYQQSNVTVISTSIVEATEIYANLGFFSTIITSSIQPIQFASPLGNPLGPFDIVKYDSFFSTTYDQASSMTQNILSYSINLQANDESLFDMGNPPLGPLYNVTPANIEQWGSTIIQYSANLGAGQIDLGWVGQWGVTPGQTGAALPGGATFDVWVNPGASGVPGVTWTNNFYITQESNNSYPYGISTFFQVVTPQQSNATEYKFRLTLPPVVGGSRSGWWQLSNGFVPYASSNSNVFQIYQDINDTYIAATDRLHLQAGDIYMDGTLNLSNINIEEFNANVIEANAAIFSTSYLEVANVSSLNVNPIQGIDTFYYKFSTVSYNASPTQVTPLTMSFITQSPDFMPTFFLIPPFMGSNQFTSFNQTSWNGTIWNNNVAFSLGAPLVFLGDVQTPLGTYAAKFWINNLASSPAYALPIYVINSAGSNLLGAVAGSTYALIQTSNGTNWTLTSNVANPQGVVGGNFSNIMSFTQTPQLTNWYNSKNLQVNAPNTTWITGSMNMFADQVRVNSRTYGSLPTTGLPSFPIGIEINVYIDSNMAFTFNAGAGFWQSDAQNVLYNINNTIFYDVNSWNMIVVPSRFRTNNCPIVSWDVQAAVINAAGTSYYVWGYDRYIQVNGPIPGGPGSGANNWNWYMAIPKNYCTYM